ncbi:MAG: hypothetical protein LBM93_00720 [Oscillospiraceae bacterium]|jgi:hypothetical protein|nr:hypothetical protein [Oscillospiraceae bacterium]
MSSNNNFNASVAIIGSFQKYYDEVLNLITYFTEQNIRITSPYKSRIYTNRNGFVLFEADDKSQSDIDIQNDTIRKILNADAVYVCNPNGYLGRTTCYEIGIIMAKEQPLYFLEPPVDNEHIISKENLAILLKIISKHM